MINIKHKSSDNIHVGDWIVAKPYGSYIAFAGIIIRQTNDTYAFLYLPECSTFPYKTRCKSIHDLLKYLNGKFEFIEKANVDLPITINTFQDVSFDENKNERKKIINKIVKDMEKDESMATENKR